MVLFTILLSSHPVQSQRQKFSMANPNPAVIILIRDNSDEKEPLALYMSFNSAKSDMGTCRSKEGIPTVGKLSAAGERGLQSKTLAYLS